MNIHLPDTHRQRGGVGRMMLAVLAIVCVLAAIEFYALHRAGRIHSASATALPPGIIGSVDTPSADTVVGERLQIAGWALAPSGIRSVDVDVDGKRYAAHYGLARNDVAAAKPGYPAAAASGFRFEGDFSALPAQRHEVSVIATGNAGETATLARKSLASRAAMSMWSDVLDANPAFAKRPFWFLMATSGVSQGGAAGIETRYQGLTSTTQRVGVSVPILYMRTTTGQAGDFEFDPRFDLSRKCHDRAVADDNLDEVIQYAIVRHLPVNFILNGGIWGDASCYSAQWDLTTHLEIDPANCQWDQHDVVLPGDFRKGLAGSTDSPQLSRSLTYNVYNTRVRNYKRRNLLEAARIVAAFAREHPDLFVGVNLDSDTYMNPFPRDGHRYDYNPGMLRQFRDWLAGSGPYAGHPTDGAPDLRFYRRPHPLTLAEVNKMAGKQWKSWAQVDPPREFAGGEGVAIKRGETPFWLDPWYQQWDAFRKHVIQLHYAELAQWAHQAGIPADRIFTAQAFTAQDRGLRPISTYVNDRSPDSDSAGVSIEGAVPRVGHLGAILYGPSAENDVDLYTRHGLFATIARFDDAWSIAETNTTDLKKPTVLPDYARAYREYRDFFNYGGRQISLMAWNGSNGIFAGQPGYVAYTSWISTPAEQAMMDFLVSHADVPAGALLWTFGSPRHADADGWTALRGDITATTNGIAATTVGDRLTLRTAPDQVIRPSHIGNLRLHFDGPAPLVYLSVSARSAGDDQWRQVAHSSGASARIEWPPQWLQRDTIVDDLEIEMMFAPATKDLRLARVLLY
ncbi:MAG: hypothetical protein ABI440_02900 [Casimicrobiaceae bacterium]